MILFIYFSLPILIILGPVDSRVTILKTVQIFSILTTCPLGEGGGHMAKTEDSYSSLKFFSGKPIDPKRMRMGNGKSFMARNFKICIIHLILSELFNPRRAGNLARTGERRSNSRTQAKRKYISRST